MTDGDGAAVRVDSRVVVRDAERIEEGEHLDGERLVDLEQPDVVDAEAGELERPPRRRHRSGAHHLGLDAGVRVGHQPHLGREPQLGGGLGGGEQGRSRAVGQRRRGRRCDTATRAERRRQPGHPLDGGAGSGRLVGGRQPPASLRVDDGDRHQVRGDLAVGEGGGVLRLRCRAVGVCPCLGQGRVPVVQVLRRRAHDEGVGRHQPLGDEPWVGLHPLAQRVGAHVLDATADRGVQSADGDLPGEQGRRRHRARAHAVDREPRNMPGQPGEHADGTSKRQTLIADLRGRGDADVADALRRQVGIASQQVADHRDGDVVRTGVRIQTVGPGPAEGGADGVHQDHVTTEQGHRRLR